MQIFICHPVTSKPFVITTCSNETIQRFIIKSRRILQIPSKLTFICFHLGKTLTQESQKTLGEINVRKEKTIRFYFTFNNGQTQIGFMSH